MKITPINLLHSGHFCGVKRNKIDSEQNKTNFQDITKAHYIYHKAHFEQVVDKASIKQTNIDILESLGARFDDLNQLASDVLHLESFDTILRFAQLKNAHFSRKLTDDEALFLARPYSIRYADACESCDEYYAIQDKFKFEVNLAQEYENRRFNDDEIEKFIKIKDFNNDFESTSQILRYIELTSEKSGLSRKLNSEEARYFARKCSSFDEIQEFLNHIENSQELKTFYDNISLRPYRLTYRTIQTDGQKELRIHTRKQNYHIIHTFVDGKLMSVIKNNISNPDVVNSWDATRRTSNVIQLASLPYKDANAIFPSEIFEILNNQNGEVDKIIHTKVDTTDGIVNTSYFSLSEYDEDRDVLKEIQEGTIFSLNKTTIKNIGSDGTLTVLQKFASSDSDTQRVYSKGDDWYYLDHVIKNNSQDVLFKTNRAFIKTGENTTLTCVDGTNYLAEFNDSSKSIVITRQDGKKYFISQILGKDLAYGSFDFDDYSKTRIEKLWRFCKSQVPADFLIILNENNTMLYPVEHDLDSEYNDSLNAIFCGENVGILAHELGHLVSLTYKKQGIDCLSQDKKLKEIYAEELEAFNANHSKEVSVQALSYFNETGSSKDRLEEQETFHARSKANLKRLRENTGLEEIVAECMYIKSVPNINNPVIAMRTHYLMMHFPKTISCAIELLNASCADLF